MSKTKDKKEKAQDKKKQPSSSVMGGVLGSILTTAIMNTLKEDEPKEERKYLWIRSNAWYRLYGATNNGSNLRGSQLGRIRWRAETEEYVWDQALLCRGFDKETLQEVVRKLEQLEKQEAQ